MTNDVETLIIKNEEQTQLTYAENKAYMLYIEIWKFLLFIKEEEFDLIRLSFSYNLDDGYGYIDKSKGLLYTQFRNKSFSQFRSFYEGCEPHFINILFNTNIDMNLFFKLISFDGFNYSILNDDNPVLVCIDIKKEQIEQKINETLIKNKILNKK